MTVAGKKTLPRGSAQKRCAKPPQGAQPAKGGHGVLLQENWLPSEKNWGEDQTSKSCQPLLATKEESPAGKNDLTLKEEPAGTTRRLKAFDYRSNSNLEKAGVNH